jgi:hypothetical protein
MADREEGGGAERTIVGVWQAHSFEVGHNALQFKLDCGQTLADGETPMTLYFRILADPSRARQLFRLLGAGLVRYADVFGPIGDDPPARAAP